jgi:hypothetical protein
MNNESRLLAATRRNFLARTTAVAAGAATLGLLPSSVLAVSPPLTFSQIPGTGDIKVLNYALALEALEADLYAQALKRLTSGGTDDNGIHIPGLNLNPNQPDVRYVIEFGKVEVQHRDFLKSALGANSLLLQAPFNHAKFKFGFERMSRKQVMDVVYTAEKIGVTAYLGAIPFFADRTYLQTAGAIQGTEARHTAVLAKVLNDLFSEGLNVAPLANQNNGRDMPVAPDRVLAEVSPFIVI